MTFPKPLVALLLSLTVWMAAPCWAETPTEARLTIVDGDAVVIRGASKSPAPLGLALKAGDIIETGHSAHLVRIEFDNKSILDLGPNTFVLLRPPLVSRKATVQSLAYVASGWIKVTAAPKDKSMVMAPQLEVQTAGALVINVGPDSIYAFAESGQATALSRSDSAAGTSEAVISPGQLVSASGGATRQLAQTAQSAWLRDVPRGFRDRLPRFIDQFANADATLATSRPVLGSDIETWLKLEPALSESLRLRWEGLEGNIDTSTTTKSAVLPAARPTVNKDNASVPSSNVPVAPPSPAPILPAMANSTERLVVASLDDPQRSVQDGWITPITFAEFDGDARSAPIRYRDGALLVEGKFVDKGLSKWAGVGVKMTLPNGALDASSYKSLEIHLGAGPTGGRKLRVRLLGVDIRLQRSGCYPVFEQVVSTRAQAYNIPVSSFVPDDFCGTTGASAKNTLREFYGVEVTDLMRPVKARAVRFNVGSVSLLK